MAAHDRSPAPLSLAGRAKWCLEHLAKADPWFHSDAMASILEMLIREIDVLMDWHLDLQFDEDGYACLATSSMSDMSEEDAPMSARRIDNGEDFKLTLKRLIARAACNTSAHLPDVGDKMAAARKGLKFIADTLNSYIGKPGNNEFLRHVTVQLAPATVPDEEDTSCIAWRIPTGTHPEALAINYFDSPVHICADDAYTHDPARPNDATHIVAFLLNALRGRQAELADADTSFRMPVVVHNDVLSLIPTNFIDDCASAHTLDGWIERKLKSIAIEHAATARTEPPLDELLTDVVELVRYYCGDDCVPHADTGRLAANIESHSAGAQNGGYTLHAVYQVLATPGIYPPAADHEKFLNFLATALLQAAPPPAIQIADTHCESSSKPGSTTRVGVLYNPFRDTVNLHLMDDDHDGHGPVQPEWLQHPWKLIVTPCDDALGTVSNIRSS